MAPTPEPTGGLSPEELALLQGDGGLDLVLPDLPAQQQQVDTLWLPEKRRRVMRKAPEIPGGMLQPGGGASYTLPFFDEERVVSGGETPADEVYNWVYDPARREQIYEYLRKKGFEVQSFEEMVELWGRAVGHATTAWMGSQTRLSPWDALDLMAPTEEEIAKRGPFRGKSYSDTQTTTHIAEMGPETARAILTDALQRALGRAPTPEEIEDFASRANAIVSANPQVTEITTEHEWDPQGGADGQGGYREVGRTTRQIGPSAEEVSAMVQAEAEDEATENPEYGAYQASTTYYNALQELIFGG